MKTNFGVWEFTTIACPVDYYDGVEVNTRGIRVVTVLPYILFIHERQLYPSLLFDIYIERPGSWYGIYIAPAAARPCSTELEYIHHV
jgi:hypothetical protein